MTEFKNELIFKIIDKLNEEMWKYQTLNWGRGLGPDDVRQMVLDILMKELKDVMVIDRNKFKEKLKVIKTNKTIGGECFLYRRYNIGLNMCQYEPEDTVCEANIDCIVDNIKEEFIAKLEECDF